METHPRRYRLTVRTEPSQGLNTGSIPVSATIKSITYRQCARARFGPGEFLHYVDRASDVDRRNRLCGTRHDAV